MDNLYEGCPARWGFALRAKAKLLIFGAGGHGESVAEAAELCGQFEVVGFVDDALPMDSCVLGYPVLGSAADLKVYGSECDQAIVAIGNNALRASLVGRLLQAGMSLATVVHPLAMISPRAQVGAGSAIMAGAIVGTEAPLGMGTIVNCGAVVDHHALLKDFGHLGVGACMAGHTGLGAKAWMQAGSALGPGVVLATGVVLSPGSTLM